MGIVNLTPDSFSDGGSFSSASAALAHCEKLLKEGADILDIGAESTRPGATPLSAEEEWGRLAPVLKEAVRLGIPVSVDTYHPPTMQKALALGADTINDIYALRQPGALEAVAAYPDCGVCLMHLHGEPASMAQTPLAADLSDQALVSQVHHFLQTRVQAATAAGIAQSRIACDPGIGFGKTPAQNFALLKHQAMLLEIGCPLLVGWSRKSSLRWATGLAVEERLAPSIAAALLSVERGASIVRVHDVKETVAALRVWQAAQATA